MRKLRSSGLSPCLVRVLESWLDDRVAEVVVGGQAAAPSSLRNFLFQGTVWGPPIMEPTLRKRPTPCEQVWVPRGRVRRRRKHVETLRGRQAKICNTRGHAEVPAMLA